MSILLVSINPLKPKGSSHYYQSEQLISNVRGVGGIIFFKF